MLPVIPNNIFLENTNKILRDIYSSKYPQSFKSLFYFQKKIDIILSSIQFINESITEDKYYTIQILTRVLFEHFIVGHYIFTKARIDNNDLCGTEYYVFYRLSEFLKRENYELGIEGIEKNIKNNATFENLKKRLEGYENKITQSDIEEIHKKGNQFEIKSILNYLINSTPSNDHYVGLNISLAHFLRQYNILSSFVHGGPNSESETFHGEPTIDKLKIIEDSIKYAKIASKTTKEHILMLMFQERFEYNELLDPIMDLKNIEF